MYKNKTKRASSPRRGGPRIPSGWLILLVLGLVCLVSFQLSILCQPPRNGVLDHHSLRAAGGPVQQPPAKDALFYDFHSGVPGLSTPRSACALVDDVRVMKQELRKGSTEVFTNCMNALKQAIDRDEDLSCESPNVLFHAFWASEDALPDTAKLGMLSTVYSQQGCAKLQLWTTNPVSQKILQDALAPYGSSEYFSVNILNMTELFATIQENFPALDDVLYRKRRLISDLTTNLEKDSAVSSNHSEDRRKQQTRYSDMIRVLVLAAYGGVYFDTDVLLLRNLKPLLSRDFFYRWSNKYYANTAVFHLKHKSPNAEKLVEHGLQGRFWQFDTVSRLCSTYHPKTVYDILARTRGTVELLPSAYMDPHWVAFDTEDSNLNDVTMRVDGLHDWLNFFTGHRTATTSVETFFVGVFAYHWHSQYRSQIGKNSVADIFMKRCEEIRESGKFS